MKFKLLEVKKEISDVWSFVFKPDNFLVWKPGQYLRYHIDDPSADERGENRFFTISTAPFEKYPQITTRIAPLSSSFKKKLFDLNIGQEITAFGPNGNFLLDDPKQKSVMIAGGIGITPFRSILVDLHYQKLPINITLLYANKTNEIVFQEELEKIATQNQEFKIQYFIGENRLTDSSIQSLSFDLKSTIFYISGPEMMMKSFVQILENLGVPPENIRHDFFPGYE
jgi:ferredoxin-NADP reductase